MDVWIILRSWIHKVFNYKGKFINYLTLLFFKLDYTLRQNSNGPPRTRYNYLNAVLQQGQDLRTLYFNNE
jgi:hypothetical protein